MPYKLGEMQLKYVTNETGEKTAVILPIEEFDELLEDLAVLVERRDEITISHKEVIAKLKQNGLLPE